MTKRIDRRDGLFLLLFLAALLLQLRRLPYGAVDADESLYLAIPWRILQGDAFLIDEWNMSQMNGFLLLPLLWLHRLLHGGGDGAYLAFRGFYLFFHALTAALIYLHLRGENRLAAGAAALIYTCFNAGGLTALSYNSMAQGLLIAAGLTLACTRNRPGEALFAGLCFAGAVLCNPFLLFVYVLYTLALLLLRRRAALRVWAWFTLGCAILAALFFLLLRLHAGPGFLRELLACLPHVVVDEAHPARTPLQVLRESYRSGLRFNSHFREVLLGSVLLSALILLDRKSRARRWLYLALASAMTLVFALPYLVTYRLDNFLMFPFSILGFFAYLLCQRRPTRLMLLLYLPGMLYWYCVSAASNLGFAAVCGASSVNLAASLLFLGRLLEELWPEGGLSRLGSSLAGLTVAALSAALLTTVVIAPFAAKDDLRRCEVGCLRGIWMPSAMQEELTREYEALAPLREVPEGRVVYLSLDSIDSYRYLEDGKRCGAYSPWLPPEEAEVMAAKLEKYWALRPENRADYIWIKQAQSGNEALYAAFPDYAAVPCPQGVILTRRAS